MSAADKIARRNRKWNEMPKKQGKPCIRRKKEDCFTQILADVLKQK